MTEPEHDARLHQVADALRRSDLHWVEVEADDSLRARVVGGAGTARRSRPPTGPRRTVPALMAAAAALVVLAGGGGYLLGTSAADDDLVSGPPGTLGAVETVTFDREPRGVDVRAAVVAHTWGTETVLDVTGLPTGRRYTVELTEADGDTLDTGSFVAVPGVTDCRMNGAVLREDVRGLRVVDDRGQAVMSARLPSTSTT